MTEQQTTDEENAWITHELDQQQYRVIADRDKGDDPQWTDIVDGDRVLYVSGSRLAMARIDRIERPVSTTDETATSSVHDMRGSREVPVALHPPTREQIAEADIAAVEEMGGCVLPTEIGMRAAFEWLAQQEGVRPGWYAEEVPAILAGIDAARRLLALIQNGADR
ncbi:hypothetical protein [Curtobacterium sp. USHLN213]|uniref:hypothetical protein n=1 Tax=Curtobacterium sp. USHLN213 TaxID=3081255 RepID=UPI003015D83F